MAISIEFNCVELEDFFSQDAVQQSGITVWVFLEMMNSGKITKGIDQTVTSMAIEEVYREIVGDVLKEVGGTLSFFSCRRLLSYGTLLAKSVAVHWLHAGLFVEEGPAEEELEGALVHSKTQQPVLLHRGGPQGLSGQHRSGW